jgi:hypothetical protein
MCLDLIYIFLVPHMARGICRSFLIEGCGGFSRVELGARPVYGRFGSDFAAEERA